MGMISQLVSMATRALSGRGGTGSSARTGQTSGTNGQRAQRIGNEVLEQVRRAGPDAAQRHLSRTRFGNDPRAQRAARTADDLARRFAGTGTPDQPPVTRQDAPPDNRYGERR